MQQVEKGVLASKSEKRSLEHSINDDAKTSAHCKSPYESSSRKDGMRLEMEDLKEVVKKWENRYRYLQRTVSSIKQKSRVMENKTMRIQPNMNTKGYKERRNAKNNNNITLFFT